MYFHASAFGGGTHYQRADDGCICADSVCAGMPAAVLCGHVDVFGGIDGVFSGYAVFMGNHQPVMDVCNADVLSAGDYTKAVSVCAGRQSHVPLYIVFSYDTAGACIAAAGRIFCMHGIFHCFLHGWRVVLPALPEEICTVFIGGFVMIKVENVSMKFRMNNDRVQSLKEYVVAAASGRLKHKDFWVFRDVDFEVEKGEVVGIIGRNGAGKSTLLKIISGILAPTCGRVKLGGRIVPMLELGSGFDVELTGRENIFLNGSILGYSESFLKEKYNEIVAFSELGDFIETPIRNYSSGMMMRLAFSIATVVQPEILIVDEILAVGDEAFQKKSKRKMLELMGGGTTVLFVSHSIVQIREMCSRVIWLENGRIKMEGETKYVCDKYQEALNPHKEDGDRQHKASDAAKNISDVLFIYGDDENAYEWRVTGQREQLLAGGVPSNEIYEKEIDSEEICWNLAKLYRVFICVNCKNTPWICRFVRLAKNLHKKVLFDFSYCAQNVWENPQEQLFAELKAECGGIIVSNRELAGRYEQYGCPVFYNPLIVRERTAEYASWAVYDRDVLPFCDPNALSEEELVNYNRAVLQKRKRQADGKRIGIFAGTWDSRAFHVAGPVLAQLLDGHKDIMLLTDLAQELFKQEQLPAGRILEAESGSLEELLRCYAQADAVLLVHTGGRQQDRLMQGWLYASFVKVPCFYMDAQAQDETLHGSGQKADWPWLDKHVACSCPGQKTAEDWAELLYRFLDDRDMRLEMGASAYESARNRHSSVDTGGRIGRHIRSVMQPLCFGRALM